MSIMGIGHGYVDVAARPGWEEVGELGLVRHTSSGRIFERCSRCGGTGEYSFNLLDGTRCYGCNGRGYGKETTLEDAQRRAKSRQRAAQRREEKRELERMAKENEAARWREEHGELMAILEHRAAQDDFLQGLLDQAQYRPLSQRQVEAAIAAVQRLAEREVAAAQQVEAGHFGTVGERVTVEVELLASKYFAAESFDRSSRYLITMRTAEGHILKAWASGAFGWVADQLLDKHGRGHRVTITGTVKEHGAYNDKPETTLTRVKIKEA